MTNNFLTGNRRNPLRPVGPVFADFKIGYRFMRVSCSDGTRPKSKAVSNVRPSARGASPIAIISYAFWKQRFGLNPAALGQTIQIRDKAFEIVGVTPPGFFGETVGEAPDIWVRIMMEQAIYPGKDYLSPSTQGILNQYMWLQVIGRLKPGVTFKQANASVNVAFKNMLESKIATLSADDRRTGLDQRVDLQPGARGSSTLHGRLGQPLKLLMVLVGLVLLIACANVANLLLAREAARQKEFVMRLAMGAATGD